MNSEQQYIDLYEQQRELICSNAPAAMNAVRDAAFADFCRLGFPSQKDERYKYTDLQQLFHPDYGLNLSRIPVPVDPYEAFRCDVPNLSTSLFFMVNDAFHAPSQHVPEGVIVDSMQRHPDVLGRYYSRLAKTSADGVTALNTMLAQDGLLVYVPRGVRAKRAVQVINILKGGAAPAFMANRRVLIVVEDDAEVQLLFCDHAADDSHFLATQVIEAFVGRNAGLSLYCLEETHNKSVRVSNVYIDQQQDSRVSHNVVTLHNGVTRNRLDLTLSGTGAECQCYGCAIADKQQHVDNNTLIVHRAPHCTSTELYKYVLDEQSVGAFSGRVLVEHGAQQTVSQMTNQNLTATPEARMYTQPMLEIYADDVKCSHGSTVGQLNDQALFYMRQRGISLSEARLLLQNAFCSDVIDKIALPPLRDRLRYLVEKRFRGELSKCKGCRLCR